MFSQLFDKFGTAKDAKYQRQNDADAYIVRDDKGTITLIDGHAPK